MGLFSRSPVVGLAAAVVAYAALWAVIPKATFLPAIVGVIQAVRAPADTRLPSSLDAAAVALLIAPTALFMAAQIAIVYHFSRIRMSLVWILLVLVGCIVGLEAALAIVVGQFGIASKIGHYPGLAEQLEIASRYYGPLKVPMTLFLMLAMASIGYMVSLRVKDRNLLLPVVMFAAYIDFWTVTRGPVSLILQHAPTVAQAVSAPIPQAGTGVFTPLASVGPGDFLFMALVFAAVAKLGMNAPRNFWFVYAAMTLGMLAVVVEAVDSLPALILLAVAVVAANRREFRLTRSEKISIAAVGVVLLVSIPILWSLFSAPTEEALKGRRGSSVSAPAGAARPGD